MLEKNIEIKLIHEPKNNTFLKNKVNSYIFLIIVNKIFNNI